MRLLPKFKSGLNDRQGHYFVDRALFNVGREDAIESESQILLFGPVSDRDVSWGLAEDEWAVLLFFLVRPHAHKNSDSVLFKLHKIIGL